MDKNNNCQIYLVRHGQTEWNVKHLIQGQLDIPLNEKGKKQAHLLSAELKNIKFDIVYSSDLKRANQTAKIIVKHTKLKIIKSKHLRERYFGRFQGKNFKEDKEIMKIIDNLKKTPSKDRKEIEMDNELMKRFFNFLKKVIKQNKGKTVLIVTHAGIIRTFLIDIGWGTHNNLTEASIDNLAYIKLLTNENLIKVIETYGIKKKIK